MISRILANYLNLAGIECSTTAYLLNYLDKHGHIKTHHLSHNLEDISLCLIIFLFENCKEQMFPYQWNCSCGKSTPG